MKAPSNSYLYDFDSRELPGPHELIAGVDEAGRGPLAGPVVAAAVILKSNKPIAFLNDSKQISPSRREALFHEIARHGMIGIGMVSEVQIDEINIYQATRVAMEKAVLALTRTPDLLLIDGKMKLKLPLAQKPLVKGDQKSAAIAAASIVAKVYRDAWMVYYDELYPGYHFKKHKGYGTRGHLRELQSRGPSPIHRKSFRPVNQWEKEVRA